MGEIQDVSNETCGSRVSAAAGSRAVARARIAVWLSEGFSLALAERLFRASRVAEWAGDAVDLVPLSSAGGAVRSSSGIAVVTRALDDYMADDVRCVFAFGSLAGHHDDERRLRRWLRQAPSDRLTFVGVWSTGAARDPEEACLIERPTGEVCAQCRVGAAGGCELMAALMTAPECEPMASPASGAAALEGVDAWLATSRLQASKLIQEAAHWLRAHCTERVAIAEIAGRVAMSERNFLRRFKREIGLRPSEFILRARLEQACELLFSTDLPLDKIARRAGFGRGDRMARLFRQHLALSPLAYREARRRRALPGAAEPAR
jgi:transcriptional regulator GlxA family with amidase domain